MVICHDHGCMSINIAVNLSVFSICTGSVCWFVFSVMRCLSTENTESTLITQLKNTQSENSVTCRGHGQQNIVQGEHISFSEFYSCVF